MKGFTVYDGRLPRCYFFPSCTVMPLFWKKPPHRDPPLSPPPPPSLPSPVPPLPFSPPSSLRPPPSTPSLSPRLSAVSIPNNPFRHHSLSTTTLFPLTSPIPLSLPPPPLIPCPFQHLAPLPGSLLSPSALFSRGANSFPSSVPTSCSPSDTAPV